MNKLYGLAQSLGDALHMHEARRVWSRDKLCPGGYMAFQLVCSHLHRHCLFFDGEHSSKATTFVSAFGFFHRDAIHQREQVFDLRKRLHVSFAGRRQTQFAHTVT